MIEGHGDDLYKYRQPITINFSSNLTNWIDATPLTNYLKEHIDNTIRNYPEPMPYTLEAQLASSLGIQADQISVTNGATEAIYLIAQAFSGSTSAILQPTFSEYADACRIYGHTITSLYNLPNQAQLPEKIRLLWLCNPNNPTGTVYKKDQLIQLIKQYPKTIFVIDQSYESFTLQPLFKASEAITFPNVILLHSMTKRYAMPGLRLGYLTGNEEMMHHLRTRRMPWSVNGVALKAGQFILENPVVLPFDLSNCLKETSNLQKQLQATGGLEVWDTDTHFMLIRLRMGKASLLKDYLANEHGLLIRDAANFEGLDHSYFRISTQRKQENKQLVQAILQWFEI